MDAPAFDPSKPFDVVSGQQAAPQQMPTPAPQTPVMPAASQPIPPQRMPNLQAATQPPQQPPQQQAPQFDPSKPFDVVSGNAPENSWAGAGKAARQGLVNAASGIAGLPGDITSLVTGGKHGTGFGSEAIQKGIEGYTGHYDPQTRLEKYIRTGAEFLPAAALPAGDLSLGARLLRLVAAPAIGSETAGQLTEGTAAEPYARMAGGIAGGYLGNKIGGASQFSPALRSSEQIGNEATTGYQSPNLSNVQFRDGAISDLQNQMRGATLNDELAPTTHKIIDTLNKPVAGKANFGWEDVQTARQLLGQEAGNFSNPVGQGAAQTAKKTLDSWLDNLNQSHLQSGNAQLAVQTYRNANSNYQVMKALDVLTGKEYAAELGAAAANSGANYENAVRQRIKGILVSPAQRNQFESLPNGDGVIQAMENVVRGGKTQNLLRILGNYMGGGGGLGAMVSGVGGMLAGAGPAGFAVPLGGAALKGVGNRMANNQIGRLADMISSQAPANAATMQARNALMNRVQGMSPAQRALVNAALARNSALLTQPQSQ